MKIISATVEPYEGDFHATVIVLSDGERQEGVSTRNNPTDAVKAALAAACNTLRDKLIATVSTKTEVTF